MSQLIDRVRAQAAQHGGVVEVPEWGDDNGPLQIHYGRISLRHISDAARMAPNDQVRQNIEVFCMIARDVDGMALFNRAEAVMLMEDADPAVLVRIMSQMGIIRGAGLDPEGN